MSLSNKYGGCGCGQNVTSGKSYGTNSYSCCNDPIQPSPTPCCESHLTIKEFGACLTPTCNVVASRETFFLKFSNLTDELPIGGGVYFFHPAAGDMTVVGVDDFGAYQVNLVDPTKAGALIQKGDCILIGFSSTNNISSNSRCLSGQFSAPAVNAQATIYIENGSSIPVGSTLTFTANGQTGSYAVASFVSASGNIYAYSITNTGNGHTPGTIISGGVAGSCIVPIELITDVNICDLSQTNSADSITSCKNGSPRAFKSTGPNDVPIGNSSGGWELGKIAGADCCVVTNDCLKFSGNNCPDGTDIVVLRDINLACFTAAWAKVQAANLTGVGQTNMPMNINGFNVVVTAYNAGTKAVTLQAVDTVPGTGISYPAGTQICMGSCCRSCINGPKFTNSQKLGGDAPLEASIYTLSTTGVLTYTPGTKRRYLIGFAPSLPLTVQTLLLTPDYDNDPQGGPGKPSVGDPLVFRSKICNNSEKGCDQFGEIQWNYEMIFDPVPLGVRVHWELGHYAQSSETLADGTTPNPFTSLSTQSAAAGYIEGPSSSDSQTILGNTAIGFGGAGSPKVFPLIQGDFRDFLYLERCNCALSIVWCYVEVEVLAVAGAPVAPGVFNSNMNIRQAIKITDAYEMPVPTNNPLAQGFN